MLIFLTGCQNDIPTVEEPTTEYKSEYFELSSTNYTIKMCCIPNDFSWVPDFNKISINDEKVYIDDEKYLGDITYGQLPEIKVSYPLEAYYSVSNNDFTFISSLEKETNGYIIKDLETNEIAAVIIKQGDVIYLVYLYIDINNEYQPRFIYKMNEEL
jgi:hypothetical protein